MARHPASPSPVRLALISILIVSSILIVFGLGNDCQWALAPQVLALKRATWAPFSSYNNTKQVQPSGVDDSQHASRSTVQGGVQVISNIYGPGSTVLYTSEVNHLGHHNLHSNGSILDTKADVKTDSPQHVERGLFTNTYKTNSKKGQVLLCYMNNPASAGSKAGSQWIDYRQLGTWGWQSDTNTVDYNHIRASLGNSDFASMDFSGGTNVVWNHAQTVTVGGVKYCATNAVYNNVFWPKIGIIFANDNHNPESRINAGEASIEPWKDDKDKPLPIVKLKQWSDIQFLTWQSLTSIKERQELKWVFRRNIINLMTVKMISDVLEKNNVGTPGTFQGTKITQAPQWPGVKLESGDEGFDALVGSPNSYGVCWMLIQHQKDMGHKTVKSIRVFDENTRGVSYYPTMIMEIADAAEVLYEGT